MERRPALTAPARAAWRVEPVGAKKRLPNRTKKLARKRRAPSGMSLTSKAPYKGQPPVLTSPNPFSTVHRRFACARLPQPCLLGSCPSVSADAHHHGIWPQQLAVAWDQLMIADPEGPSFITRTVGRRQYADDASVSHDPCRKSQSRCSNRENAHPRSSDSLVSLS